jgi:carotenoid 1,2-hydratase
MSDQNPAQIGELRIEAADPPHELHRAGGIRSQISGNGRGVVRPGPARLEGLICASGGEDEAARAISGRRLGASRTGPADGGDIRTDRRQLRFDRPVKPGGYAWWYVDAISADGSQALTLIAFIGSVFSPYYAWANRKMPAPAENFCAMNVALYQRRGGYWAMTERGSAKLQQSADTQRIGPSALHWDGAVLTAEIDERCAPLPRRLHGSIRLRPLIQQSEIFHLDAGKRHRWQPISPVATVDVSFDAPELSWSGEAYFDSNDGDVPLAEDFTSWQWARVGDKILYDVEYPDGGSKNLALQIATDGTVNRFTAPPPQSLPGTLWRMQRNLRADTGNDAQLLKTFEDAPFYARSMVATRIAGEPLTGVHESLSLKRFSAPWVRVLLPFRMPRFS